jgi:hypothetical protein
VERNKGNFWLAILDHGIRELFLLSGFRDFPALHIFQETLHREVCNSMKRRTEGFLEADKLVTALSTLDFAIRPLRFISQ